MPAPGEPAPIPVRPAARPMEPASQDRVALALTLMTKFALDQRTDDRDATAAAIAGALEALGTGAELSPQLRRLCVRLHRIWAAVGSPPDPAPGPPPGCAE